MSPSSSSVVIVVMVVRVMIGVVRREVEHPRHGQLTHVARAAIWWLIIGTLLNFGKQLFFKKNFFQKSTTKLTETYYIRVGKLFHCVTCLKFAKANGSGRTLLNLVELGCLIHKGKL